ncbi:hypothetical protein Fmac_028798 [Flemingia macrophylla]|uniref:Uncharacterized protein n=1 Tax=Flemingia macrophylla TaxID=520843 RepID=A0ABD1L8J7_9FABA
MEEKLKRKIEKGAANGKKIEAKTTNASFGLINTRFNPCLARKTNKKIEIKLVDFISRNQKWLATIVGAIFIYRLLKLAKGNALPLPPGPKPWSIVGNLPHMGHEPQRPDSVGSNTWATYASLDG